MGFRRLFSIGALASLAATLPATGLAFFNNIGLWGQGTDIYPPGSIGPGAFYYGDQAVNVGELPLIVTMPGAPTVDDYAQIRVMKVLGASAPSVALCDRVANPSPPQMIYNNNGPWGSTISLIDTATTIYNVYSYRLCIYDAAGNLTSGANETMLNKPASACEKNDLTFSSSDDFRTENGGCTQFGGLTWRYWVLGSATWAQADAHCAALTEGGHTDWRVPTRAEVANTVGASRASVHMALETYASWTTTTAGCPGGSHWIHRPSDGVEFCYFDVNTDGSVRCVRP